MFPRQKNKRSLKYIDNVRGALYNKITKLHSGKTAPKDKAAFFIPDLRGMRGVNISNSVRSLCTLVESPTCSSLGGNTESINKMTINDFILFLNNQKIKLRQTVGIRIIPEYSDYGLLLMALTKCLESMPASVESDTLNIDFMDMHLEIKKRPNND